MRRIGQERSGDRIKSALAVAAFHALLGYALGVGLRFEMPGVAIDTLKLFDVAQAPPPPPVERSVPTEIRTEAPEGAAAPAGLSADPSPVVAPPPEIRLDVPPPLIAAPLAGSGSDASAGASDRPGPGAGGIGTGAGSGGSGSGAGGGAPATRARQVAGRIVDRDYPRGAWKARIEGRVLVRFTVGTDGRAGGCATLRSSGHAELDAATCRLIEARFRFEPARDAAGRPVPDVKGWEQVWWLEGRRPAPPPG